MRYAHGIFIGAILTGVIFIGCALIRVAGYGISDPSTLQWLWSLYTTWFFLSIAIIVAPPIIVYFADRARFKEFLIFEVGGVAFFTPFWLCFATELSGTPWLTVFVSGVEAAIPFPGPEGTLWGVNIDGFVVVGLMSLSLVFGMYILRPAFIKQMTAVAGPTTTAVRPGGTSPPVSGGPPTSTIEREMPDVTGPVSDDRALQRLRVFLIELSVPEPVINALVSAGVTTVEELITTPANKIAEYARLDERTAKDLYNAIQKKWFSV